LKKLNVQPIGEIEEVNLIMENGTVIHFSNPKVQASIPSNIYVVSGPNETKKLEDILPQIYSQLGTDQIGELHSTQKSEPESNKTEDIPDTPAFDA